MLKAGCYLIDNYFSNKQDAVKSLFSNNAPAHIGYWFSPHKIAL